MSELTPAVKAAILRQVASEQHPKLALPNIAHRHGLTMPELQTLLQKHGWPRPESMRRAAQLLEDTAAADGQPARPLASVPVEQPTTEPEPRQSLPPAPDDTIADVLTQAATSHKARTRNLGLKIAGMVADLRQALDVEADEAEARAEVERLREQLRKAQAKLRGGRPTSPSTAKAPAAGGEEFTCPVDGCDKAFPSKQGLNMHNTRVHREAATA